MRRIVTSRGLGDPGSAAAAVAALTPAALCTSGNPTVLAFQTSWNSTASAVTTLPTDGFYGPTTATAVRSLRPSAPSACTVSATAAGTAALATCAFSAYTDTSIAQTLADCGRQALNAAPSVSADAAMIYNAALAGAAAGMSSAGFVFVSIEVVEAILGAIGQSVAEDILVELVREIVQEIITLIADVTGVTIASGAVVGASSFGAIGAVIGAVIGAIVALVEYLDPSHLQITSPPYGNGTTFACKDYASTVIPSAGNWVAAKGSSLVGLTALGFAKQANLFLANPTWMWANQTMTGIPQPSPPDQGQGSAIDLCYTQLPGAFELLNKAQFVQACAMLGFAPIQLPFYMTILKPTGTPVMIKSAISLNDPNPIPIPVDPAMIKSGNPNNYSPLWTQGQLLWAGAESSPTGGYQGFNQWPAGTVPWSDPNPPASKSGQAYMEYVYPGCPNIATNDVVRSDDGTIIGQTDMPDGCFVLQKVFPALTTDQCLTIFNISTQPYAAAFQAATTWANQQCYVDEYVLASIPGVGPLTAPDIARIIKQWVQPSSNPTDLNYNATCNPSKHDAMVLAAAWINDSCPYPPTVDEVLTNTKGSGITAADAQQLVSAWHNPNCKNPVSTSTAAGTLVKTTALVGGATAIGISWYAARNGMSIAKATKVLFDAAKMKAKRIV